METYRDQASDFDLPSATEASGDDVSAQIGTDERRMHVRAYNYWVSLLADRDFPSIEDLEPGEVQDFAAHSVLLDFTCGRDNPAIPYLGAAIRDECALDDGVGTIADVPNRSLLSRLTDHFMQIIANRAPVGFEAEFENPRGETICYRGILMPFSSDGDTIDFIYGVINWKRVGAEITPLREPFSFVESKSNDADEGPVPCEEASEPLELTNIFEGQTEVNGEGGSDFTPLDLIVPSATETDDRVFDGSEITGQSAANVHFAWEDGPLADVAGSPIVNLAENAGLADRLWAARETAENVKAGEGRTRSALYMALSLAYDFALAAEENPDDYRELLEESGMKPQARAPMTPIVKLVFGFDYDKARLTEFAAALSYGRRQELALGEFQGLIEKQPGGLKALVAAERHARRPEKSAVAKGELARARLRSAPAIALTDVPSGDEFAVVLTRRGVGGMHEPVAIIDDEAMLERAIRRAA